VSVHHRDGVGALLRGLVDGYPGVLHLDDVVHGELLSGDADHDRLTPVVDPPQGLDVASQDLGLEDDDEASHVLALDADLDRLLNRLGVHAEGVVYGVKTTDVLRQKVEEPLLEVVLQLREPHPLVDDGVGGDDPKRSGVSYDEDPLLLGEGLL